MIVPLQRLIEIWKFHKYYGRKRFTFFKQVLWIYDILEELGRRIDGEWQQLHGISQLFVEISGAVLLWKAIFYEKRTNLTAPGEEYIACLT